MRMSAKQEKARLDIARSLAFHALCCLFDKQTTSRGYETGTSGRVRAGMRGHGALGSDG